MCQSLLVGRGHQTAIVTYHIYWQTKAGGVVLKVPYMFFEATGGKYSHVVSSDLGIVVSCSQSSDVLLHSIRKGRLIRRLPGVVAHAVCLSSEGVVLTWNNTDNSLSTYTLNGSPIVRAQLLLSGSISCMETSFDGWSALIGINSSMDTDSSFGDFGDLSGESEKNEEIKSLDTPSPSVCLLDIHTLEVFHILKLGEGREITSLALNADNTNLLVSTADKQLIIFTDPALSLKVVDQMLMLKLGWQGDGLSPLIKS